MQSENSQITVYGLRNCDTCRKAMRWLEDNNVAFTFHDVRADGLRRDVLEQWLESKFAASLLNRRSTTWRNLSDAQRDSALQSPANTLMEHPTLLKRPVITDGDKVLSVGFSPEALEGHV